MRNDPHTISETILIWKRNDKIIRTTWAYLFLSVVLVWHRMNCLSRKRNIFEKHTLTQEFLSGRKVSFILTSLIFFRVLLTSFFYLVIFKILLHEWLFWIVTKYNSKVNIHTYFWTSSVLQILQFKYDSILSSNNHFNYLGYTTYLSESFYRVLDVQQK